MRPGLALVLALGALLPGAWALAPQMLPASAPDPVLALEPGPDAPDAARARDGSLRLDLQSFAGATIRYDDAARLSYRGESPASVTISLAGGQAWSLGVPAALTMEPGETIAIPIQISLPEGAERAGPARLVAQVVAS